MDVHVLVVCLQQDVFYAQVTAALHPGFLYFALNRVSRFHFNLKPAPTAGISSNVSETLEIDHDGRAPRRGEQAHVLLLDVHSATQHTLRLRDHVLDHVLV
jgi:hypothetical protein